MPRFRFHVLNDTTFTVDEEGIVLSDLDAVRAHAVTALGEIIAEELRQGRDDIHLAVMVDGEAGERVADFRSSTRLVASENPFAPTPRAG